MLFSGVVIPRQSSNKKAFWAFRKRGRRKDIVALRTMLQFVSLVHDRFSRRGKRSGSSNGMRADPRSLCYETALEL